MIQNARFWSLVIIILMTGLLFLNYSNRIDYVKLSDYRPPNPTPGTSITCASFSTQKEAQDYFDANGASFSGLDGDRDGIVCESLP